MPGSFYDTNVLIYFAGTYPEKAERARCLLASGGTISVQVLNEIANVGRRKLGLAWRDVHHLLETLRGLVDVVPVSIQTHEIGLGLAERYQFALYDSMIVAAALAAKCDTLFSEDMQHGLVVKGGLRIMNPFRG